MSTYCRMRLLCLLSVNNSACEGSDIRAVAWCASRHLSTMRCELAAIVWDGRVECEAFVHHIFYMFIIFYGKRSPDDAGLTNSTTSGTKGWPKEYDPISHRSILPSKPGRSVAGTRLGKATFWPFPRRRPLFAQGPLTLIGLGAGCHRTG